MRVSFAITTAPLPRLVARSPATVTTSMGRIDMVKFPLTMGRFIAQPLEVLSAGLGDALRLLLLLGQ